jgi:NAD(P)-dependent dehydrogenase (short-subunit alcohol dehydrogenase family)
MGRLTGKIAFVTGGGGALGSAIARRFISEGARVAIADIDETAAQRVALELGDAAIGVSIDVADEVSVASAFAQCDERLGEPTILVNNAALTDAATLREDVDVASVPIATWSKVFGVNVAGYVLCAQQSIQRIRRAGGGVIVNVSSGAGVLSDQSRPAYGASKAAIIHLTRQITTMHGRDGVRCNGIAPGAIITPLYEAVAGESIAVLKRHTPLGELGAPRDIAELALFLAGDESRYINGQTIIIDGGLSVRQPHVADLQELLPG